MTQPGRQGTCVPPVSPAPCATQRNKDDRFMARGFLPFSTRSPMPLRPRDVATACRLTLLAGAASLGWTSAAYATVAVLQPVREAAAEQPLELTLLYSDDDKQPLTIDVPKALNITLTNGDLPPQPLALQREPNAPDKLMLRPGQYRKVRYAAPWPDAARGVMKVDPVGFDSSPMLIT